jgi:DNA polymerase I
MTPVHRPVQKGDTVFLVDASNFVFRAYFQSIRQDPKYNYRSDKLPTGAVRLFCTKLFQFIEKGAAGVRPTHLAVIFDKSEKSFRKELYPLYKANRSEPPEDLVPQFPLMREAVRAFGLIPIEQDRYEADDLIATYACQAHERGADVLIVSADKDLMQLIRPGVSMFDPASGTQGSAGAREERRISGDEVIDYFGVPPEKVVDVQSLAGDSTDNVPGAPGIGVKTAAQLINEYGDLETLLARAGEIKQPKRRETLTNPEIVEQVRISKKLVELVCDVPLECPLDDTGLSQPDGKALVAFLKAMEFTTITKRAGEVFGVEAGEIEPAADLRAKAAGGCATAQGRKPPSERCGREPASAQARRSLQSAPRQPRRRRADAPAARPRRCAPARRIASLQSVHRREVLRNRDERKTRSTAGSPNAYEAGRMCVDTETSSLDPFDADLVGVALATAPGRACYIPIRHCKTGEAGDLFQESGLQWKANSRANL